jgi:hypothetical protein
MTKTAKLPNVQRLSYCAIDRHGRIVYLGHDEAEAEQFRAGGAIVRSGRRMGDAMRTASMEYGASVQQRHNK